MHEVRDGSMSRGVMRCLESTNGTVALRRGLETYLAMTDLLQRRLEPVCDTVIFAYVIGSLVDVDVLDKAAHGLYAGILGVLQHLQAVSAAPLSFYLQKITHVGTRWRRAPQ